MGKPVKRGRPEMFPVKFQMAITEEMRSSLDDWRRQQPDLPSRLEAVRRLLEKALVRKD